jgi:ketosteroid isomerase-like protein
MDQHDVVRRYLHAMQRGADGEDDLVQLFADDGEYIESFSGAATSHRARAAIRGWLRASWPHQPPDIRLVIEHATVEGDDVSASWRCESGAFEKPSRGIDTYTIRDGLIRSSGDRRHRATAAALTPWLGYSAWPPCPTPVALIVTTSPAP